MSRLLSICAVSQYDRGTQLLHETWKITALPMLDKLIIFQAHDAYRLHRKAFPCRGNRFICAYVCCMNDNVGNDVVVLSKNMFQLDMDIGKSHLTESSCLQKPLPPICHFRWHCMINEVRRDHADHFFHFLLIPGIIEATKQGFIFFAHAFFSFLLGRFIWTLDI